MTQKEAFKFGQSSGSFENVISPSRSDSVVLQPQSGQICLIPQRLCQIKHHVIIKVIVIQKELFKGGVVLYGPRNGFQANISNEVALQG